MNEAERQDNGDAEQAQDQDDLGTVSPQFILPLFVDEARTQQYALTLTDVPLKDFWEVSKTIQEIGLERVKQLLWFALGICQALTDLQVPNPGQAFDAVWDELAAIMTIPGKRWEKPEDYVLTFTYALLRRQSITHKQAAHLASKLLNQHFTEDAWRRRVARWARTQGLPSVERRPGRPKKNPSISE